MDWNRAGGNTQSNLRQIKQQLESTTVFPDHAAYKRQNKTNTTLIRSIPNKPPATLHVNKNNGFSHKSETDQVDRTVKIEKMPTTVHITPRFSTGKRAFPYQVTFDMSRTKSLVSEDVETLFGSTEVLTYPGPVGLTDARGQPIHCSGEVTFCVTIASKSTSMGAWTTTDIQSGQLIIGSGVMEDLNLELRDVPDDLSPGNYAQDERTLRNPCGSSAVTRSSRTNRQPNIKPRKTYEETDFLLPLFNCSRTRQRRKVEIRMVACIPHRIRRDRTRRYNLQIEDTDFRKKNPDIT